jgi:hypothetical protein
LREQFEFYDEIEQAMDGVDIIQTFDGSKDGDADSEETANLKEDESISITQEDYRRKRRQRKEGELLRYLKERDKKLDERYEKELVQMNETTQDRFQTIVEKLNLIIDFLESIEQRRKPMTN